MLVLLFHMGDLFLFFFYIKADGSAYLQELSELCVAEVLVPLVAKV